MRDLHQDVAGSDGDQRQRAGGSYHTAKISDLSEGSERIAAALKRPKPVDIDFDTVNIRTSTLEGVGKPNPALSFQNIYLHRRHEGVEAAS